MAKKGQKFQKYSGDEIKEILEKNKSGGLSTLICTS